MTYDLVVLGGEIVSSRRIERADIGIIDGRIAAIGDLRNASAAEILAATGLAVLPGIIDTQVHFREPGMEHKEDIESGTRAAICGGVTTVFEMPNTIPPTTTREALQDKIQRAHGNSWCNIAFFVGAALDNLEELAELENLPGTPGIKLFMGSSTGTLLVPDDDHVRCVLQNGRRPVPVHSEDHLRLESRRSAIRNGDVASHPDWRDAECARLCTERLIGLARETGRPVHILHVSTVDELPLIRGAKSEGVKVTAEILPQHLWFCAEEVYAKWGSLAQQNPPIRSRVHRDALRQAVKDGMFDIMGSDHAPHTTKEKEQEYPRSPSGMPGVQTLAGAMLTIGQKRHLFDVRGFVKLAAENPAQLYGLANKGRIDIGYDADLAIFDLNSNREVKASWLQSKCGWSCFEGETFTAWPIHAILGGEIIVRKEKLVGLPIGTQPQFDWK